MLSILYTYKLPLIVLAPVPPSPPLDSLFFCCHMNHYENMKSLTCVVHQVMKKRDNHISALKSQLAPVEIAKEMILSIRDDNYHDVQTKPL